MLDCVWMCVCLNIYIYIYIYIHTHTRWLFAINFINNVVIINGSYSLIFWGMLYDLNTTDLLWSLFLILCDTPLIGVLHQTAIRFYDVNIQIILFLCIYCFTAIYWQRWVDWFVITIISYSCNDTCYKGIYLMPQCLLALSWCVDYENGMQISFCTFHDMYVPIHLIWTFYLITLNELA